MTPQAMMSGTRLAYVIVPIHGTVEREKITLETKTRDRNGKATMVERKIVKVDEPYGFMVYFPRGHAVRLKDKRRLAHYGLSRTPQFVNMSGLEDPNSPVAKLMRAQDDAERKGIMTSLEQKVVQMVEHRVGKCVGEYTPVRAAKEAA